MHIFKTPLCIAVKTRQNLEIVRKVKTLVGLITIPRSRISEGGDDLSNLEFQPNRVLVYAGRL